MEEEVLICITWAFLILELMGKRIRYLENTKACFAESLDLVK